MTVSSSAAVAGAEALAALGSVSILTPCLGVNSGTWGGGGQEVGWGGVLVTSLGRQTSAGECVQVQHARQRTSAALGALHTP
jgi:hypothetical protein